jgi:hypothetical protein
MAMASTVVRMLHRILGGATGIVNASRLSHRLPHLYRCYPPLLAFKLNFEEGHAFSDTAKVFTDTYGLPRGHPSDQCSN